jgi:hypothetical protein
MSISLRPLRYTTAVLVLAPLAVTAQQQPAPTYVGGEVMFVSGQASRVKTGGVAETVAKGMTLLEGDTIKTAANSHVYVRLRDGGLLVVRPSSDLHVDLWRYDPARPQDSTIKYTLDSGVARHVSGAGAKAARDKFRFNTPMAAIGVRGTDFTVLADPSMTRISVQSGGVIMNSLGGGCRADGVGPCEGSSAVELFASARDKLLQLRAGERRPEVIEDANATPDHLRPPAASEPTSQRKAPDADIFAESRTSEFVGLAERSAAPPAPVAPPAAAPLPAPPPVAPPPPPEPPKPAITIASWGRWASLAEKDTGVVNLDELLKGRSLVGINSYFALAANPSTAKMELPGSGTGSFKLFSHDGVITDTVTKVRTASTASDASLNIDFGTRQFNTSMTVSAGAVSIPIKATGAVDPDGRFASAVFVSPAAITGLVGGSQGSEAVYLYQRSVKGYDAAGVASWLK